MHFHFPFFHTDLVHCTNEPNVSIPHLANLLVERTQNANWVVVYKSLLTVHHLLAYGNEVGLACSSSQLDDSYKFSFCLVFVSFFPGGEQRFMQYLASSNSTFNLSNFLDKGGVQGKIKITALSYSRCILLYLNQNLPCDNLTKALE